MASADTVADRNHAAAFAAEARVQQRLEFDSTRTSAVLSVGAEDWPMPIPIVEQGGKWYFDAAAGKEEILRRRIGQNELDAITVCRGFVEAQREYARVRHDGALVNQYAQRVISTPGKQDGLAWQTADGTWAGPGGRGDRPRHRARAIPIAASRSTATTTRCSRARARRRRWARWTSWWKGAMIGGFALVAAPAEYGVTGIQTFIVSWEGVVYQKDLGEKTLETFRTMERYNPDSTWQVVQEP